MQLTVKRVEVSNQTFTRKSDGKEFLVDNTIIVSDIAKSSEKFNENAEFGQRGSVSYGFEEFEYQVGLVPSSEHFFKMGLDKLKGNLPCVLEVELAQGHNAYDQPITVIKSVKLPSKGSNNAS